MQQQPDQLELIPRDYRQGLTDQERQLLDSIRRSGFELMAVIRETTHSGQHWRYRRAIVQNAS